MLFARTIIINFLIAILFFTFNSEAQARTGKNKAGVKLGIINPRDYEAYFPLDADEVMEVINYKPLSLHVFYLRQLTSHLKAGIDIGFAGIVDKSDDNTILKAYPIDLHITRNLFKMKGVTTGLGAGYTYWIMDKKDGGMQGISGVFTKLEFLYNIAHLEISYSKIDQFGQKTNDLGGISIRAGISYRFSYY